jgi:hypothetical protein
MNNGGKTLQVLIWGWMNRAGEGRLMLHGGGSDKNKEMIVART